MATEELGELLGQLKEKTYYFKNLNKLLVKRLRETVASIPNVQKVIDDVRLVVQSNIERQRKWSDDLFCKDILMYHAHLSDFEKDDTKILDLFRKGTGDFRYERPSQEDVFRAALAKDLTKLNAGSITDVLFPNLTEGSLLSKVKESLEERIGNMKKGKPLPAASMFDVPLFCFEELKLLGAGGFADVYYAKYEKQEVAVKMLRGFSYTDASVKEFNKEIQILCSLNSPYVIKFIGACMSGCMGILMEFAAGGTLQDYLTKTRSIPIHMKVRMTKDIALGLQVLHDHKMLHCDLKAANVLLDGDLHCKLADFGLSIAKNENTVRMTVTANAAFGTLPFMPPEVLTESNPKYNVSTDVYSFGMLSWQIGTQLFPYASVLPQLLAAQVCAGFREQIPENMPRPYQKLIAACWHQDPSARPSIKAILQLLEQAQPSKYRAELVRLLREWQTFRNSCSIDEFQRARATAIEAIEKEFAEFKASIMARIDERKQLVLDRLYEHDDNSLYFCEFEEQKTDAHVKKIKKMLNGTLPVDLTEFVDSSLYEVCRIPTATVSPTAVFQDCKSQLESNLSSIMGTINIVDGGYPTLPRGARYRNVKLEEVLDEHGSVTTWVGHRYCSDNVDGLLAEARIAGPHALFYSHAENSLFVCQAYWDTHRLRQIDLNSGTVRSICDPDEQSQLVACCQAKSGGPIFVISRTESGANCIKQFSSEGEIKWFAGQDKGSSIDGDISVASFRDLRDITINQSGTLYVTECEEKEGRLRKVTPEGTTSTMAVPLTHPDALCHSSTRDCLFIADDNALKRVDCKTGNCTVISSVSRWHAFSVALNDDESELLIFGDTGIVHVSIDDDKYPATRLASKSGYADGLLSKAKLGFSYGNYIAFGRNRTAYVTDSRYHCIRMLRLPLTALIDRNHNDNDDDDKEDDDSEAYDVDDDDDDNNNNETTTTMTEPTETTNLTTETS